MGAGPAKMVEDHRKLAIFDRDPANWEELQDMTGQLFDEIGCDVVVGKPIDNVRGAKEIDVFVRDCRDDAPCSLSLRVQTLETRGAARNSARLSNGNGRRRGA
jgi:hypothetical protein